MIANLEPIGIRSLKLTKLFKYLLLTPSVSSSGFAKVQVPHTKYPLILKLCFQSL